MTNELWFKRKTYGWGWTPANAKGWLVIAAFVIAISAYPLLCMYGYAQFSVFVFMATIVISTAGLIAVCVCKGEKPKWSWGSNEE